MVASVDRWSDSTVTREGQTPLENHTMFLDNLEMELTVTKCNNDHYSQQQRVKVGIPYQL
jgi:hypothetical protein